MPGGPRSDFNDREMKITGSCRLVVRYCTLTEVLIGYDNY